MLFRKPPSDGRSLMVRRTPVELVFYEDGISPLTVTLPPYDELREIESLRGANFSISQHVELENTRLKGEFAAEREHLESKFNRFRGSSTYIYRLAALAGEAGDFEGEGRYLKELRQIESSEFADNRLGEHLVRKGDVRAAESLFEQANLGSNIHANLRLASFYVAREDFAAAVARVEQALKIDATDYSARLFYGTLKIFLGDYHLAIVSLRIATEERPNSAAAFTNMAVAYLRLQKPDRALVCLKRAVALDPLSSTAVALLADVANTLDVSEDAVPALRYFVRFEQQSAAIWARLGRALIHMQEYGEAIAALKRESSVTDAPDLWNNMGVAHFLRGDKKKAGEAFVHAMRISGDPKTYAFCLAAKNAAAVLMQSGEPEGALKLVDIALREDNRYLILHRDDLAQLILIKLDALTRLKEVDSANEFAEHLLGMEEASLQLKGWVASGLLTQYALRDDRKQQAVLLAEEWLGLVDSLPTRKQRVQVLNNVAFSFIEGGLLQQGEAALSKISFAIHREPYPTATLGLLHLRRGRIERARDLYSEAVMLCSTSDDRARIRQKWNLEEAALLLEDEPRRALKLLEKVWRDDEGEPLLRERAGRFLKSIDRNRLNLGKSGK